MYAAELPQQRGLRRALEHEGELPSGETGGLSRHKRPPLRRRPQPPIRHATRAYLETQRRMRASPPVSSTHTSHEESPQAPVAAAIAHKLKHAGAQPTCDTPADPPQKAMRLAHALPHHPHRLLATPSQKASCIFATLDKESERPDAIGLGLRLLTPWTS
jgi:hypothetical protein